MGLNQKSFEISLKKGEIGEFIVTQLLEDRGWIVYKPFTKGKAHYFDILATYEKEKVIAIDVKTKARLNKWSAQGIDIKHYDQYLRFTSKHKVPFYLVFIDDKSGDVHLADIGKLNNPIYPNEKIIAWRLDEMKHVMKISKEQIAELSKYDQRNYEYNPI